MKDFPEINYEGLGGISVFNFIPTHDVLEIPRSASIRLDQPVVLRSGKEWFEGASVKRTLLFTEKKTRQGTYDYSIKGVISGKSEDIIELFENMDRRQFVLDATDFNGNRRLIGSPENGMAFSWQGDSGNSPSSRNDYTFEFTAELAEPAYIYAPV